MQESNICLESSLTVDLLSEHNKESFMMDPASFHPSLLQSTYYLFTYVAVVVVGLKSDRQVQFLALGVAVAWTIASGWVFQVATTTYLSFK